MAFGNRQGIYRARDGKISGVLLGLARYFDVSVRWLRIFTILLAVFTGFWPVLGLYVVAALIMKPEPAPVPPPPGRDGWGSREERDSWGGRGERHGHGCRHHRHDSYDPDCRERQTDYVTSRREAAHGIKDKCDTLDRRLQRMEEIVTSKEFDWERRLSQPKD